MGFPDFMNHLKNVQDLLLLEGISRLIIIGIMLLSVLVAHYTLLRLWNFRSFLVNRPLPRLLVNPHVELIVCSQAVIGASESSGALIASKRTAGICPGMLTLLLIMIFNGKSTRVHLYEALPDGSARICLLHHQFL